MQPPKVLSSLVDSNFNVIPSNAIIFPAGSVVNVPTFTPPPPTANLDANYNVMYQLAGLNITLLNQFMGSYNKFGTGLPGNITDFATQYAKFLVAQGLITEPDIPQAVGSVLNGFAISFQTATSFATDINQAQALSILFPGAGIYGTGNAAQDPDQYAMVNTLWGSFINQYNYQSSGSIANGTTTSSEGFFQNLSVYLAVTATVSSGASLIVNNGSGGLVFATSAATPSFENIFYQYFPTPNPSPEFVEELTTFARNVIQQYGYFSPSLQYTQFVKYVQDVSNTKAPAVATLPPTDVNILFDIFSLIGKMVGAIQNIAASQASRLALYTSWQKGYTDLLNQVPAFTGSSNDRLRNTRPGDPSDFILGDDSPSGTKVTTRNNQQANFNSAITQQITAYSNTIQEDAKSLQSNVNQSTDAFNNQASTATSLLQTISTIMNAIFR